MVTTVVDATIFARKNEKVNEAIITDHVETLCDKIDGLIERYFDARSPQTPVRFDMSGWTVPDKTELIKPIVDEVIRLYRAVGWTVYHNCPRGGGATGTLELSTTIERLPAAVEGVDRDT